MFEHNLADSTDFQLSIILKNGPVFAHYAMLGYCYKGNGGIK